MNPDHERAIGEAWAALEKALLLVHQAQQTLSALRTPQTPRKRLSRKQVLEIFDNGLDQHQRSQTTKRGKHASYKSAGNQAAQDCSTKRTRNRRSGGNPD